LILPYNREILDPQGLWNGGVPTEPTTHALGASFSRESDPLAMEIDDSISRFVLSLLIIDRSPKTHQEEQPKMDYRVIDSDTHITEPADTWTSRVARKWRNVVPRVEKDSETGVEWWIINGKRTSTVGITAMAGWPGKFPAHPPTYAEAHPAAYDANARLAHMDKTGVYAEVLYPNVAGFGNQAFLAMGDPKLMLTCVEAYNDFLVDWISPAPERFIPVMSMPVWDVNACVREVERCADRGFGGILFSCAPQTFGFPILGDRYWDPFWSVCQEADLPVSFHIGNGDFLDVFTPDRLAIDGFAVTYARTAVDLFIGNGKHLADLLLCGVLARYPKLKFVSVESGVGWIPFVLEAVDYSFGKADVRAEHPEFDMLPSEYFRNQVYSCYWFEKELSVDLLNKVGIKNIMFETDFPHPTCIHEDVNDVIDSCLSNLPEDVQHDIVWGNAAKLYGISDPS